MMTAYVYVPLGLLLAVTIALVLVYLTRFTVRRAAAYLARRANLTVGGISWFERGRGLLSLSDIEYDTRRAKKTDERGDYLKLRHVSVFLRRPDPDSKHKWLTLEVHGLEATSDIQTLPRGNVKETTIGSRASPAKTGETSRAPNVSILGNLDLNTASRDEDISTHTTAENSNALSESYNRFMRRWLLRTLEFAVFIVVSFVDLHFVETVVRVTPVASLAFDNLSINLNYGNDVQRSSIPLETPPENHQNDNIAIGRNAPTAAKFPNPFGESTFKKRHSRRLALKVTMEALSIDALDPMDTPTEVGRELGNDDEAHEHSHTAFELCGVTTVILSCSADHGYRRLNDVGVHMNVDPISIYLHNVLRIAKMLPRSTSPTERTNCSTSVDMGSSRFPAIKLSHRRSISVGTNVHGDTNSSTLFTSISTKKINAFPRCTDIFFKSITVHYVPHREDVSQRFSGTKMVNNEICESAAIAAGDISFQIHLNPVSESDYHTNCLPQVLERINLDVSRVVGDCKGFQTTGWRLHLLEVGKMQMSLKGGQSLEGRLKINAPSLRIDLARIPALYGLLLNLSADIDGLRRSNQGANPLESRGGDVSRNQRSSSARKPSRRMPRRGSYVTTSETTLSGLLAYLPGEMVENLEVFPATAIDLDILEPSISIWSENSKQAADVGLLCNCPRLDLHLRFGGTVDADLKAHVDDVQKDYFSFTSTTSENTTDMKQTPGLLQVHLAAQKTCICIDSKKVSQIGTKTAQNVFSWSSCAFRITWQLFKRRLSPMMPSPLDRPDSFHEDSSHGGKIDRSDLIIEMEVAEVDVCFVEDSQNLPASLTEAMQKAIKKTKLQSPPRAVENKMSLMQLSVGQVILQNAAILFEMKGAVFRIAGNPLEGDKRRRGVELATDHIRIVSTRASGRSFGDLKWLAASAMPRIDMLVAKFRVSAIKEKTLSRTAPVDPANFCDSWESSEILEIPSIDTRLSAFPTLRDQTNLDLAVVVHITDVTAHMSVARFYACFIAINSLKSLISAAAIRADTTDDLQEGNRIDAETKSESKKPSANVTPFVRSTTITCTIARSDLIVSLPGELQTFFELDEFTAKYGGDGHAKCTFKTARLLGITPNTTSTKSELLRFNDGRISIEPLDADQATVGGDGISSTKSVKDSKNTENTANRHSHVVIMEFGSLQSRLPYRYIFADVIDSINNFVKIGKKLGQRFKADNGESDLRSLPKNSSVPTIKVSVQTVNMRVDDDPFEIALTRAHAVGLEEQKARLARDHAFQNKLSKLNQSVQKGSQLEKDSSHQNLSSGASYDVHSAYRSLQEYNSRNWIRRVREYIATQLNQQVTQNLDDDCDNLKTGSSQSNASELDISYGGRKTHLYSTFGPSTTLAGLKAAGSAQDVRVKPAVRPVPLFRISMSNLEVTLTDPGFGIDKAPEMIADLDGHSSRLDQQYDLLLPWNLTFQMTEATVQVRDHPYPLVHIPRAHRSANSEEHGTKSQLKGEDASGLDASFSLEGLVILAEPLSGQESFYSIRVPVDGVGEDAELFEMEIERAVSPVKLFMDLRTEICSEMPTQLTMGAAVLPSLQDVSRAMETLSKTSLDPSPPIGFWDKIRLLLHGRFEVDFKPPSRTSTSKQPTHTPDDGTKNTPLGPSPAGGFCLRLRGSRDPYYGKHRGTGSSGYEVIWQGNTKISLGKPDFIAVESDNFFVGVPRPQEWIYEQKDVNLRYSNLSESDANQGDGYQRRAVPTAWKAFEKVVVNLSGRSRWSAGVRFENDCVSDGCNHSACLPSAPHSTVNLRAPEHAQSFGGIKYDSYRTFRSAVIHASLGLSALASPHSGEPAYNILHLTPQFLSHFEDWIDLFAGNMALPIRRGALFTDSPATSMKLGRYLSSVQLSCSISPIFTTYMHINDHSLTNSADYGIKGRAQRLVMSLLMARETKAENLAEAKWSITEANIDFSDLDLRAVMYDRTIPYSDGLSRSKQARSFCESESQIDVQLGSMDSNLFVDGGRGDDEWDDADDYTEIGQSVDDYNGNFATTVVDTGSSSSPQSAEHPIMGSPSIKPFIFCPRLVYFTGTSSQILKADAKNEARAADEHEICIRDGRDTAAVQILRFKTRLEELENAISKEAVTLKEMEDRLTEVDENILKDICAHIKVHVDRMGILHHKRRVIERYLLSVQPGGQETTGIPSPSFHLSDWDAGEPQVAAPLLTDAKADLFTHRYVAHNALILWNENVRNCMFKFLDMQQQHFAFKYYMSQTAAAFIRAVSEKRADNRASVHLNQEHDIHNSNEAFDHEAAEELLSMLVNEEGEKFVVQNEQFDENGKSGSRSREDVRQDAPAESLQPTHPDYIQDGYVTRNDHLVQLIHPQLNFQSNENGTGCMIISAERMQWKAMAILDENYLRHRNNELVKTRSLFAADNAQYFVAFKNHFNTPPPGHQIQNYGARKLGDPWPAWVPLECLVDHGDDFRPFQRVVDRTSFTLHHDKHNPLRLVRKKHNPHQIFTSRADPIDERADSLNLHFPRIAISANSLQYSVIFEVVTDLLVYNDPIRKSRAEHVKALALAADLDNLRGAADGITLLQERIRGLSDVQRQYRISLHQLRQSEHASQSLAQYELVNKELLESKEQLYILMEAFTAVQQVKVDSEEVMLAVQTTIKAEQVSWEMLSDSNVVFAECSLINAAFVLRNNEDHSSMKWLEVDQLRLTNKLPSPFFTELVGPYTSDQRRINVVDFSRQKMLRVYWEEMAPVGGIAVVHHFEVNMFPLVFQMTYDIGKYLISYIFPENRKRETPGPAAASTAADSPTSEAADNFEYYRAAANASTSRLSLSITDDGLNQDDTSTSTTLTGSALAASARELSAAARAGIANDSSTIGATSTSPQRRSRLYPGKVTKSDNDLHQLATRASQNKMFVYIKIPGVPHFVSYQGSKESNFVDLTGFLFRLPTLEYRNKTWTWLEFLMQIKKDIIFTVLAHAGSLVNQKFQQLRAKNNAPTVPPITIPTQQSLSGPTSPKSPSNLAPLRSAPINGIAKSRSLTRLSDVIVLDRVRGSTSFTTSLSSLASEEESVDGNDGRANNMTPAKKKKSKMFKGFKNKMREIIKQDDGEDSAKSSSFSNVRSSVVSLTSEEESSKGKLLFGKLYDHQSTT